MKAVAVESCGVIPLPVTMLGVTVPLARIFPAPLAAVPIAAYVTVPAPPVPAGKEIVATGLTLLFVTVQPPEVRAPPPPP